MNGEFVSNEFSDPQNIALRNVIVQLKIQF